MSARIVGLVGSDGTGTSTHARLLVERIRASGVPASTRWVRFRHRRSLPALALARLAGLSWTERLPGGARVGYHDLGRWPGLARAYARSFVADQRAMMRRLERDAASADGVIVADRFLFDGLVDLALSTGDPRIVEGQLGERLARLRPPSARVIALDAPFETIAKRRPDVALDRTARRKLELFRVVAKRFEIPVVDTSGPVEEAASRIAELAEVP